MKSIYVFVIVVSMLLLLFGAISSADAMGGTRGNGGTVMNCGCGGNKANCSCVKCKCGECGNGTTSVPEPSTFILFGSMLIGAIGVKKVITG